MLDMATSMMIREGLIADEAKLQVEEVADPDIENHEGVAFRKIAEGNKNLKYLLDRHSDI